MNVLSFLICRIHPVRLYLLPPLEFLQKGSWNCLMPSNSIRKSPQVNVTVQNVQVFCLDFICASKCIVVAVFLYAILTFPSANDIVPSENTPAEKTERKTEDGLSEACLQKELKKHREADKDGTQTIIVSEKQHCT